VIVGTHEALNMLLAELDLLALLRGGRAGIKQRESQKRRKQRPREPPTGGHRVSVSNERHCMVLHLDILLHPTIFGCLKGAALTGPARSKRPRPTVMQATGRDLPSLPHGHGSAYGRREFLANGRGPADPTRGKLSRTSVDRHHAG